MSVATLRWDELMRPGVLALRRFWLPFVLLQAMALLTVVLYLTWEPFRFWADQLAEAKVAGGLLASMLAMAFAGGVLPEVARRLTGQNSERGRFLYDLLVFAGAGLIVEYQIRFLGWAIGTDRSLQTVLIKVLIDQTLFSIVIGCPYYALMYGWREHGFRPRSLLREVGWAWYLRRVLPLQVAAWAYWLPMVAVIYTMPVSLQFCLFVPVLGAWSVILVRIVAHRPVEASEGSP